MNLNFDSAANSFGVKLEGKNNFNNLNASNYVSNTSLSNASTSNVAQMNNNYNTTNNNNNNNDTTLTNSTNGVASAAIVVPGTTKKKSRKRNANPNGAKRQRKKKPPKEKKIRPKPGQIRETTALDGSKLFLCPECQMASPHRAVVEQHVIQHAVERRFVCDICHAALKRKDHLTRHKLSHIPDRPHICNVSRCHFECILKVNFNGVYFTDLPEVVQAQGAAYFALHNSQWRKEARLWRVR